MKKWYTISALCIAIGAIAVWYFTESFNYEGNASAEEQQKEQEEKAGKKAYYEWLFELRKNPATGTLTLDDILEGRRQVEAYHSKHGTRDGSLLSLDWDWMGPNNQGGRTRAIVIDPNNPNRMYAGGISGGLFITDNAGQSWYPAAGNKDLGSLLVGAIALADDGTLYVGTGEGNTGYYDGSTSPFTHAFVGNGIYKSTDSGTSFTILSATEPTPGVMGSTSSSSWAYVYRVNAKPGESNTLVAAQNKGLYYTTDGGETWTACTSLVTGGAMNTSDAQEALFDSEGYLHAIYSNRYYRSVTNTDPFTLDLYGEGLPISGLSRVTICVAPSDANYVYAYAAKSDETLKGIYRSTDKGLNFEAISPEASTLFNPPAEQGGYNLVIAVNPADKDRVYIGGAVEAYTWRDGGAWTAMSNGNFATYDPKYIHADQHVIVFHPTDPNIMYYGSDGGISRTTNALAAYPDFATMNKGYGTYQANGIAIGYYGEAAGGSQDNGTFFTSFLGNSTLEGMEILGGDGGRAHISKIRPEYLFGAYASFPSTGVNGGNLRRSVNGGASSASLFDCHIDYTGGGGTGCSQDGAPDGGGEFVAEWKIWENWNLYNTFKGILEEGGTVEYPAGSGTFYALGDEVNFEGRTIELTKSNIQESRLYFASGANVWVTDGALYSSTEPAVWYKIQTGSLLGTPSAFEYDNTGDILYVGTSSGRLYRFEGLLEANFEYVGDVFDPAAAGITQFLYTNTFGSRITGISINRDDPNELALSIGGYGVDQNIFYSTNALADSSAVFTGIAGELPNIPAYDVLIESYNPDVILAATEYGVWSYNVTLGGEWTQEAEEIGNVPVMEIREDWVRDVTCSAIYIGTHGRGFYRAINLAPGTCDFTKQNDVAEDVGPIQEEIIAGVVVAPNPADELTTLSLYLARSTSLNIKIYNMNGELKSATGLNVYPAGTNNIPVNVSTLTPGTYLLVVESVGGYPKSVKLTVY